MSLMPLHLINALANACRDAMQRGLPHDVSGRDIVNAFFREWYAPYTFVFRKNIKTTDLQYRELLALIRIHTTSLSLLEISKCPGRRSEALLFEKSKNMKIVFESVWNSVALFPTINAAPVTLDESIQDLPPSLARKILSVCYKYGGLFYETIMLDAYSGHCQVFVPKTAAFNASAICSESGYVYTCGRTIYNRRSTKVNLLTLREKICSYLQDENGDEPIYFVIWSNETFPKSSNLDVQRMERNGVDDLKFHLDKYYFVFAPIADLFSLLTDDTYPPDESHSSDPEKSIQRKRREQALYLKDKLDHFLVDQI